MSVNVLREFLSQFLASILDELQLHFLCQVTLTLVVLQRAGYNALARAMRGDGNVAAALSGVYRRVGGLPAVKSWSAALAKLALSDRSGRRVVLATDWTDIGHYRILVTGIVAGGRVLPILWTVMGSFGDQVQAELLHYEGLGQILPRNRPYVLLADRGFGHARTIRELRKIEISFVLRTKMGTSIRHPGERLFTRLKDIGYEPGAVQDFGNVDFVESNQVTVRVIRSGMIRHNEPWLLLTDLDAPARIIVRLYGYRFRIEGTFRDLKDTRYGLGLKGYVFRQGESLERLFSVTVLVYWILHLVGLHAKKRNWHADYQSRTNEMALWRVGIYMLRDPKRAGLITVDHLLVQVGAAAVKTGQWDWRPRPEEVLKTWPSLTCTESMPRRRNKRRLERHCDVLLRNRIRTMLAQTHLTQVQLAASLDRRPQNLGAVLSGRQPVPANWISVLATTLSVTQEALLSGTGWTPAKRGRRRKISFLRQQSTSSQPHTPVKRNR